jgi:branched-chain amino acid transport system ATP-binding protein
VRNALPEIVELFPVLGKRLNQTAGSLSGGEQQMLALSRAYITKPKVVVVDEASFGLAPLIVDRIYEALRELVRRGTSLVVVEQYVHKALALADTVYILSKGQVVHKGRAADIDADVIYEQYLGVEA